MMLGCLLVMGLALASSATADADQLSVSLGSSTPEQGLPLTVSYGGESSLTSFEGGSLEVWAATVAAYIRPAGGAPCQANSGADAQVAGSADISISGSKLFFAPGPISDTGTATPPAPGPYVLCAWLEVVNGDGILTSTVLASTSTVFTVQAPQAHLSLQAPATATPGAPFTVSYTTQTDQALSLSIATRPYNSTACASSAQLEGGTSDSGEEWLVSNQPVFGGPITASASTTESAAGQYVVCAWIEGPTAGEVDADASALVQVGKPPHATPAVNCPNAPIGARVVCFAEAILAGEPVTGWPLRNGARYPASPIPYVWGGGHSASVGPSLGTCTGRAQPCQADKQVGLDCSGFTRWVYALAFGHDVLGSGNNDSQRRIPGMLAVEHPSPGDLVFYGPARRTNHVAIYSGSGKVIAEPSTGGHLERVRVTQFGAPRYVSYES